MATRRSRLFRFLRLSLVGLTLLDCSATSPDGAPERRPTPAGRPAARTSATPALLTTASPPSSSPPAASASPPSSAPPAASASPTSSSPPAAWTRGRAADAIRRLVIRRDCEPPGPFSDASSRGACLALVAHSLSKRSAFGDVLLRDADDALGAAPPQRGEAIWSLLRLQLAERQITLGDRAAALRGLDVIAPLVDRSTDVVVKGWLARVEARAGAIDRAVLRAAPLSAGVRCTVTAESARTHHREGRARDAALSMAAALKDVSRLDRAELQGCVPSALSALVEQGRVADAVRLVTRSIDANPQLACAVLTVSELPHGSPPLQVAYARALAREATLDVLTPGCPLTLAAAAARRGDAVVARRMVDRELARPALGGIAPAIKGANMLPVTLALGQIDPLAEPAATSHRAALLAWAELLDEEPDRPMDPRFDAWLNQQP